MISQTFSVAGQNYQAAKIPPFDQLAIAKRMMPVMKNILTPEILLNVMQSRGEAGKIDMSKIDLPKLIPAMCDAIYSLSDEDAERIVRTALKVVQRQGAAGVWGSLMTAQGVLMYDDVDLIKMMQIAWKVIEANLGSFFSTAP